MPSRFVKVQATDLISLERKAEEELRPSVIVHVSEEIIDTLMVAELEDHARDAVENIKDINKRLSTNKTDFLVRESEQETALLSHLNYMINFFGGEEQHLPEDIAGGP